MNEDKKCPRCGAPVQDGSAFCGECGCPLNGQQNAGEYQYHTPYRMPMETVDKLSILDYIIMLIVFQIPFIGLIFMFVWGFGRSYGPNRKNFARAYLIIYVIMYVIAIILAVALAGFFSSVGSGIVSGSSTMF